MFDFARLLGEHLDFICSCKIKWFLTPLLNVKIEVVKIKKIKIIIDFSLNLNLVENNK